MHPTQLAIKHLEQVASLNIQILKYIAEDAVATSDFVDSLIEQGHKNESVLNFQSRRMAKSQELLATIRETQRALKAGQ